MVGGPGRYLLIVRRIGMLFGERFAPELAGFFGVTLFVGETQVAQRTEDCQALFVGGDTARQWPETLSG